MKTVFACILMLVPVALVPGAVSAQQLLKCVGKDGKVEYAAQCASGAKEQQTGIRNTKEGPTTDAKGSAAQKSIAEKDAEFRKRQTDQQTAETKKAEDAKDAEARKANCENSRSTLAALEGGERVTRNDPVTGERSFLDDNERKKATDEARRSVAGWCK